MDSKKKELKSLIDCGFSTNLGKTLQELDKTTRNALAVEAKIRPLTINDIVSGKVKQINFETLRAILEALNRISEAKGISKRYTVSDVFEYEYQEDSE